MQDGTYVEDRYSSPTVARSISLTDTRNRKGRNTDCQRPMERL